MRDTVPDVTATELLPDSAGETSVMQRIGLLVRDARRHRGLTQLQLAERLATSQSAVARIEQGGQNLTLDLLGRLSAALGSELISVGPSAPSGPTHLRVTGGRTLHGSVTVKSSKNAAVALLCAALLNRGRRRPRWPRHRSSAARRGSGRPRRCGPRCATSSGRDLTL